MHLGRAGELWIWMETSLWLTCCQVKVLHHVLGLQSGRASGIELKPPWESKPAVGSWLSPVFFPVAKKRVQGSLLHSGLCAAILEDLPGSCCCLWWGSTEGHLGCSLTTPQAGLFLQLFALCSGLEGPALWRRDGLGCFQFLPKWCFHLITCPWHRELSP